jgi:VanZ family protein
VRLLRWTPPVIWSLVILFLTSIPNPSIPAPKDSDKLVHFFVYAVLGALTGRAALLQRRQLALALALVAGISVFGAIDEWHQHFIPGRSPAVNDWVADTIGGVVGIAAMMVVSIRRSHTA